MGMFDETLPQGKVPREQASYGAPVDDLEWLLINYRAGRLSENSGGEFNALNAARDERKAEIEKRTGKSFDEAVMPYRVKALEGMTDLQRAAGAAAQAGGGEQVLFVERNPDDMAADALVADMQSQGQGTGLLRNGELRQRSRELAYEAAMTREDAAVLNDGDFSAGVAGFLGQAGNSMSDPVLLSLLPLGLAFPEMSIPATMATEGGLGGLGSAISLPGIAAWQKEIGLPEMTGEDMAKQVALDAALSAGTAGLLKVGGRALSQLVTPRKAVDAFDRAFPDRDTAPPDLVARRDTLEVIADLADDNPLGDTPAQEAEHLRRVAEVNAAVQQDKPLPRYPEDDKAVVEAPAPAKVEDPAPADDIPIIEVKKRKWTQRRPQGLQEFIAGEGGIRDDGGELAARGINTRNSMTLNGPWAKKAGEQVGGGLYGGTSKRQGKGLAPDEMRRRLVEAGYMRDTPYEGGAAKTTADDMYALIDRAIAGERVVSEADLPWEAELAATRKAREENDASLEPYREAFGKNAYVAVRHGEDFAREAVAARKAGVKWTDEDLQWADDFAKETGESVRVSLDEAIYRRMLRQEDAAREAELAPPPELDDALNSLPVGTDETGKIITFGELAQSRQGVPDAGSPRNGPGRESPVPGQRRTGGSDGEQGQFGNDAGQQTADLTPDPAPDNPQASLPSAGVRELLDQVPEPDDLAGRQIEIADLSAQLQARLDDGADLDMAVQAVTDGEYASYKDWLDELDADDEFISAVKVCLE